MNLAARLEPFGKQTGLPLAFSNAAATGAAHPDLITINAIPIRGRAEAEIVYSHLPLSQETKALHEAVAELIISGSKTKAKSYQSLRDKLASRADYPQTLLSYYDGQFR